MDHKFIVRTVDFSKERIENVQILKEQLPELIVLTDKNRNEYSTLFEAFEAINNTGGVLFEDDVKLCSNFKQRINNKIFEKGTDKIINFFERPNVYIKEEYVRGSLFFWMQCVYLPPELPVKLIKHFDGFKVYSNGKTRGAPDWFLQYAFMKENVKYWRIRPCLVQHLDFKSTFGGRSKKRITPFFVDDLEAKGLNYEDLEPSK